MLLFLALLPSSSPCNWTEKAQYEEQQEATIPKKAAVSAEFQDEMDSLYVYDNKSYKRLSLHSHCAENSAIHGTFRKCIRSIMVFPTWFCGVFIAIPSLIGWFLNMTNNMLRKQWQTYIIVTCSVRAIPQAFAQCIRLQKVKNVSSATVEHSFVVSWLLMSITYYRLIAWKYEDRLVNLRAQWYQLFPHIFVPVRRIRSLCFFLLPISFSCRESRGTKYEQSILTSRLLTDVESERTCTTAHAHIPDHSTPMQLHQRIESFDEWCGEIWLYSTGLQW